MSFEATALLLAWGAIVVLAFAMAGLLRQVKALTLLNTRTPVPAGGPARGQRLPAELLSGTPSANGTGGTRVLIFMDRDCPGCMALAPELARLDGDREVQVTLVFPNGGGRPTDAARLAVLEGMSAACVNGQQESPLVAR